VVLEADGSFGKKYPVTTYGMVWHKAVMTECLTLICRILYINSLRTRWL